MSEFLCCDRCGELSMYDCVIYINNKPVCSTCHEKTIYTLQTAEKTDNSMKHGLKR